MIIKRKKLKREKENVLAMSPGGKEQDKERKMIRPDSN